MSLTWFTPHKIDDVSEALTGLREMGVRFEVDDVPVTYRVVDDGGHERLMKYIGWTMLYDDGHVECRFRAGANRYDIRVLIGAAEKVMMGNCKVSKATGWQRGASQGKRRWLSSVCVQVDERTEGDRAARIIEDYRRGRPSNGPAAVDALFVKVDA